jgi:hypothetical protein
MRAWGRALPAVQGAPTNSPTVPDRLTRTAGNSSITASTCSLMSLLISSERKGLNKGKA